ncbi:MAG: hypothetical protein E7316_00290 [Clostridiales bacterium]|nr:hypothetical protein [Clostridiales bacterium]
MSITGISKEILVNGRKITFFNQRNRDWTHPYAYHNTENLSSAGCGIFSLCHCAQWLTGHVQTPEKWADFSCANGGRGDDGTDRPGLLHALMSTGMNTLLGLRYEEDGLRNDLDILYQFLLNGDGVAMCNLRVGHIVSLVAAREKDGVRQVLAIDSYSESASEKVRDHVIEVLPGSEVTYAVKNAAGLIVGESTAYAAFWVDASLPRDFNLLHRI